MSDDNGQLMAKPDARTVQFVETLIGMAEQGLMTADQQLGVTDEACEFASQLIQAITSMLDAVESGEPLEDVDVTRTALAVGVEGLANIRQQTAEGRRRLVYVRSQAADVRAGFRAVVSRQRGRP